MRPPIVGVMGPALAGPASLIAAETIGRWIAERGWITLSGGRDAGVMAAVNRGARQSGGLTLGILPSEDTVGMSPDVIVPIRTGMGSARNNINVLSADVVIALATGAGAGTLSEMALAIKAGKTLLVHSQDTSTSLYWRQQHGVRVFEEVAPLLDELERVVSELPETRGRLPVIS